MKKSYLIKNMTLSQFSLIMVQTKSLFVSMIKEMTLLSFKNITPFQTKFKTPIKKNNKTLHQQSLLLNDTDVTSNDEDHIYTRIPKSDSSFIQDTPLPTENYSTLKQLTPNTTQKSVSAINVQPNLPSLTHSPQIILFYDTSFFKYKNYFQGFFLPDDYSLDKTTLQQQQSQDPVLRTVYSWIIKNEKPETLTPLITGTPFLHAYYKRFILRFIDDSTNLISFYTKHPTTLNQSSTPDFVRATIRICLPFRLFKTVFNKLHEHSYTGIKNTYNTFTQYYYIPFVEKQCFCSDGGAYLKCAEQNSHYALSFGSEGKHFFHFELIVFDHKKILVL